jgi:hypothetical protein
MFGPSGVSIVQNDHSASSVRHVPQSRHVRGTDHLVRGRNTPLVRDFRKRVGLVEELRQLAGSEERVDDRRKRTRIDQVNGVNTSLSRTFIRSRMVRAIRAKTYAKLGVQLLAYRAYTAVAQVVNVVNFRLLVHQADEISTMAIMSSRVSTKVFQDVKSQFAVDLIATYFPRL